MQVLPIIEKHNRQDTFPMHLVPALAELGFFGANLKGYGCVEISNVAYGLVMQELEREMEDCELSTTMSFLESRVLMVLFRA